MAIIRATTAITGADRHEPAKTVKPSGGFNRLVRQTIGNIASETSPIRHAVRA